jgi:hypothetical protein
MFDNLDVTVTATLRPALLDLTLWAFRRNFFSRLAGTRIRILLNIDPLWGDPADAPKLAEIARAHADEVVVRTAETPGFGEAVRWLWSRSQTAWIFHLEDDWILTRRIDVEQLAKEMSRPKAAQVRFNRRRNHFFRRPRFSLNPCLLRRAFVVEALAGFDPAKDPEKQILRGPLRPLERKWRYYEHGPAFHHAVVVDTGRPWREMLEITKSADKMLPRWTSGNGRRIDDAALAPYISRWRSEVEAAERFRPV